MAFVDFASREINCKVVYYGPGLGGKTKNLKFLHERTCPSRRGQLVSLATETERTLFFDFLPLDVGSLRGFRTRLHLYSVPGQVFYDAARRALLCGVDGIVFVADSQAARLPANVESIRNLKKNLEYAGYDLATIPYVLQLNKRDLPTALPAGELVRHLSIKGEPTLEAAAATGAGVFETLKAIAREVLLDLRRRK
ncbi:MAG TPA: gliding-motility protein MglA [Thermoanaerobaculia bacterium]|nr:gliding-motility protein MglA [Thermoanaerobaculia bacterium]